MILHNLTDINILFQLLHQEESFSIHTGNTVLTSELVFPTNPRIQLILLDIQDLQDV